MSKIKRILSIVHSGADQKRLESSASLAFMRGIHRWPVNSPHKGPVTRKMFPFDDVIMESDFIDKHPVDTFTISFVCRLCPIAFKRCRIVFWFQISHKLNSSQFTLSCYCYLDKYEHISIEFYWPMYTFSCKKLLWNCLHVNANDRKLRDIRAPYIPTNDSRYDVKNIVFSPDEGSWEGPKPLSPTHQI